jgi:hypothetical protein
MALAWQFPCRLPQKRTRRPEGRFLLLPSGAAFPKSGFSAAAAATSRPPAASLGAQDDRPSRHCLGPRDMPLEAKRFRHVAVAIPEVAIAGGIAVSPRQ